MKNLFINAMSILLLLAFKLSAQLPVSKVPQNKSVFLEHFYGFKCQWSPQGDSIAEDIRLKYPKRVVVMNIHNFFQFSAPSMAWPDYTTTDGLAILNMPGMNCTSIPSGPINRHKFPFHGPLSISRYSWKSYSDSILAQPAYVNVALQGTLNIVTRVLQVEAQVYYTGNSPAASNSLSILLYEDNVVGPQVGGMYVSNWNGPGKYKHQHILRKYLTPTFGTTIPATTSGYSYTTKVSYAVPLTYGAGSYTNLCNISNLRIAAFVAESSREIQNVTTGPVYLSNFTMARNITLSGLSTPSVVCSSLSETTFRFANYGGDTITNAVFEYQFNNEQAVYQTWTGSAPPLSTNNIVNAPPTLYFNMPKETNFLSVSLLTLNADSDEDPSDNSLQSNPMKASTFIATDHHLTMEFKQDMYGDQCRWELYNEHTQALVASDGPWWVLNGPGTLSHVESFTVTPGDCYRLVVTDKGGDGISNTSGYGNYKLSSGSGTILYSDGKYGKEEIKKFRSQNTVSLIENFKNESAIVYPNPSAGQINLALELSQNEAVGISIMNSMGKIVQEIRQRDVAPGKNLISIETEGWANGVYFVNISTSEHSVRTNFIIAR